MPTYEYRCTKCGEHFDVYQSFSDEPLKKHEACGGKLNKVLGPVGIVFKGSGFYRTDNRGGSKRSTESGKETSKEKESAGAGSSSSTSNSDTKSDSKSGSKSDSKPASKSPEAKSA
jgi:putative FmdB family regulatory protein